MAKVLFQTNINALHKVKAQLMLSQTMTHRQVLLRHSNQERLKEAEKKIEQAIELLNEIQ